MMRLSIFHQQPEMEGYPDIVIDTSKSSILWHQLRLVVLGLSIVLHDLILLWRLCFIWEFSLRVCAGPALCWVVYSGGLKASIE
ncbi:uncharacterized protein EI90DRAFT_3080655 [Cantharellus anzutake]|uniref:uncharacterized protein n=1 Tax=Cantharellus anzutake TaxID=1750568 RepID=UPI001902FFCB|nr:uncharacterized protein EI90DRAFT_3091970 [Cantharellus anzutake]XP_038910373.1 uncharacterized protein EI90DRAFT_3080655 [Cantharellus anzutake]KAF8313370.1 hypothetical protein EI90DRAFT_3091970 [Cantharellus anzutake]KAF8320572.1 hypothetical protein EI90DRAFT_3080655 [Cantharellus anzutake]